MVHGACRTVPQAQGIITMSYSVDYPRWWEALEDLTSVVEERGYVSCENVLYTPSYGYTSVLCPLTDDQTLTELESVNECYYISRHLTKRGRIVRYRRYTERSGRCRTFPYNYTRRKP